ncbi:hypothetical protein BpHYR1_048782 [Brachionus plicatilis]|uniref:Uncharacterized protein n=1 Tax=Brachionus plicatilis TaxID=10195 RepID=A0A3M7QXX6_BRAPC|nr:hypothetical protein BpHYR1_048782 [Brachionus plicatilis]
MKVTEYAMGINANNFMMNSKSRKVEEKSLNFSATSLTSCRTSQVIWLACGSIAAYNRSLTDHQLQQFNYQQPTMYTIQTMKSSWNSLNEYIIWNDSMHEIEITNKTWKLSICSQTF